MIIIAAIDFFEGLIAVIRDEYYVFGPQQIIVFDMTTWGWITMIWGVILGLAGLGLLAGSSWARWFTIVVGSINIIAQLGSFGNQAYPLWALASLALTLVVLYALIVRWGPAQEEIVREGM
jgi:hypothetical protein